MLDLFELATVLHAELTGFSDRALNVVTMSSSLDESERPLLLKALEAATPEERIIAIGDALRVSDIDRSLVNEAYRAAFYGSDDWRHLSLDPLFAFFSANHAGHVLDKWVHYFPIYSRHFAPYVGKPISLLEIGVYRGGSMRMWSSYFGPQTRLVGLDIDPLAKTAAGDRYEVVIGDQTDTDLLRQVVEQYGPFDIIIDDGGHTMEQQIASAEALFPGVKEGGIYLVEDCHTSYWADYGGGRNRAGTFMEWTKDRLDDMHGYHQPADSVHPEWTQHLDGLHVYDSIVVLDRKKRFAPFCEQNGGAEFVFGSRPASIIASELVATRQAVLDQRAAVDQEVARLEAALAEAERRAEDGDYVRDLEAQLAQSEEELRGIRGEFGALRPRLAATQRQLAAREDELGLLRNKLLDSWDHVREMRHTVSWRATSPLRRLRGTR